MHSADSLQLLVKEEEGGSNFQVALIPGHTLSWVEPHWQQEFWMYWGPLLRPLGLRHSTVQPALLKPEDSETSPKCITEVLITAKCDKPWCEELLYIEAMTILCLYLTLAQKLLDVQR